MSTKGHLTSISQSAEDCADFMTKNIMDENMRNTIYKWITLSYGAGAERYLYEAIKIISRKFHISEEEIKEALYGYSNPLLN